MLGRRGAVGSPKKMPGRGFLGPGVGVLGVVGAGLAVPARVVRGAASRGACGCFGGPPACPQLWCGLSVDAPGCLYGPGLGRQRASGLSQAVGGRQDNQI